MYKYKYKFYLDTNHAIYINNTLGQIHPHTWEITLYVKDKNLGFTEFKAIENIILPILLPYQNKNMNSVEPFTTINPTIENVCKYFFNVFKDELFKKNILLEKIEFCESPKCSFIIDNSDYSFSDTNIYNNTNSETENDKIVNDIIADILNKKKDVE